MVVLEVLVVDEIKQAEVPQSCFPSLYTFVMSQKFSAVCSYLITCGGRPVIGDDKESRVFVMILCKWCSGLMQL